MQPSSPFCGWEIATKEDAFCGDEAVTLLPNLTSLILQKQWCCWEHKGRPLTLLVYSLVISRDAGDTKCGIWSPPPPSNISTPTSIRAWASYPGEGSFILTHNWPNHPPERERKRDQRKAHTWSCSLVSGGKGGAFLLIWCSTASLPQAYSKDNHSFLRDVMLNLYLPNLMPCCLAAPLLLLMWRMEQQSKKDGMTRWKKRKRAQHSWPNPKDASPSLDMLMSQPSCPTVLCLLSTNKGPADQILQKNCTLLDNGEAM